MMMMTRSSEAGRRTDLRHSHQVTRTGRSRNECCSGSRIPTGNRNPTGGKKRPKFRFPCQLLDWWL